MKSEMSAVYPSGASIKPFASIKLHKMILQKTHTQKNGETCEICRGGLPYAIKLISVNHLNIKLTFLSLKYADIS